MVRLRVLVACEESQAVCKAFRQLGHDAFSCDLQECSGGHPEWHITGDALQLLNLPWDIVIAHPPCTYLSNAGACRLYPKAGGPPDEKRLALGMEGRAFFMKFLENGNCNHIAVENPMPSKIYNLPPQTQIVQPYEFGHPFTKKTYLWLRGLPALLPTGIVKPTGPYLPSGTSRKKKDKYGIAQTAKDRSKTFPCIAKAMAEQWAEYVIRTDYNS